MTPIRIQVLYCESITNMRMSPINDVVCAAPLAGSGLEAVNRERPGASQLRGLRWGEMGRLDRLDHAEIFDETASTNWAVVEVSVDPDRLVHDELPTFDDGQIKTPGAQIGVRRRLVVRDTR